MFETLQGESTRRAMLIAPFALAGIAIFAIRRRQDTAEENSPAASNEQVTIVEFDDAGRRIGPARVAKVVRSSSQWRKQLSAEQFYVARQQGTDVAFSGRQVGDPDLAAVNGVAPRLHETCLLQTMKPAFSRQSSRSVTHGTKTAVFTRCEISRQSIGFMAW